MRIAELRHNEPAPKPDGLDIKLHIAHIHTDLFRRTHRDKGCERCCKDRRAILRHPARDTDHILLGDAHIDTALRKYFLKTTETGRTDEIARHRIKIHAALCQIEQCHAKYGTRAELRPQPRFALCEFHHASPTSAIAR